MNKLFQKKNLKTMGLVLLVLAVVAFAASLVKGFVVADDNDKIETFVSYKIGALTEYGKYTETKESIYSDLFECKGLEVYPDFDSDIQFEVFFYDEEENFILKTNKMNETYKVGDDEPELSTATYARIVIYPTFEKGDDKEINFFEKLTLSTQLKIKVLKDQTVEDDE